MENTFSLKDIYDGALMAGTDMSLGSKFFSKGDTILSFDDIQALNLTEQNSKTDSRGGWNNAPLVGWEITSEAYGSISVGTISKFGMAILNNTELKKESYPYLIRETEEGCTNGKGEFILKFVPEASKPISIFLLEEGSKSPEILDYSIDENTLKIENVYSDILVEYWFYYEDPVDMISIGEKDLNGYLSFVGKFHYTDERTLVKKTGIVEIPKLRILSDFQIRLGRSINPLISNLSFQAIPVGDRHRAKTINLFYLDSDIG